MVPSLKPFGCMPPTQSHGAQSAVVAHYKDMIFLPIETSGEGDVNAHSRVQMALGEAKVRARNEIKSILDETGVTLDEVRDFATEQPEKCLESLKRYREDLVYRKQKRAEIDAKLKELEAQLPAELDAVPGEKLPPGPPPTPYVVETPIEINAIRPEQW
jgi:hypothetical protein